MALSIESIYKPVNDFFLNKFQAPDESPVFFRFDKLGSVVGATDEDGNPIDPPEALEQFSDLTNRLAVHDDDDVNIMFSASPIDEEYINLVKAAIPFVPPGDPNAEAIVSNFSAVKAEALKEWSNLSQVRGGQTPEVGDYHPSFAMPETWYKTDSDVWTAQNFQIKESTTVEGGTPPKKFNIWKFKLPDEQLIKLMPSLQTTKVDPLSIRKDVVSRQLVVKRGGVPQPVVIRDHRFKKRTFLGGITGGVARRREDVRIRHTGSGTVVRDHRDEGQESATVVNLKAGLRQMDINNRLAVLQVIRDKAPTRPSEVTSLSIQFDYCVVNIRRPWLIDAFTKNRSWFIPGMTKGQSTRTGGEVSLSVLPIGFLAIKNLTIEADWSKVEIDAAKNATDFGPFEVDTEIINNKLSHEGIQIIGWVLQRMPELPPNDPPQV